MPGRLSDSINANRCSGALVRDAQASALPCGAILLAHDIRPGFILDTNGALANMTPQRHHPRTIDPLLLGPGANILLVHDARQELEGRMLTAHEPRKPNRSVRIQPDLRYVERPPVDPQPSSAMHGTTLPRAPQPLTELSTSGLVGVLLLTCWPTLRLIFEYVSEEVIDLGVNVRRLVFKEGRGVVECFGVGQ